MPDDYRLKRVYPNSRARTANAWAARAETLVERHNSAQQHGADNDQTLPSAQPGGSTLRNAYRRLKGFFGRRTTMPQGMTGNNRRFMREMSE